MWFKKPILVTGAHRSGSTWVGHVITSSKRVKLVYEPFNINTSAKRNLPFKYWNEYVSLNTSHSKRELKASIEGLYSFKFVMLKYPYRLLNFSNLRLYFYKIWSSITYRPLLKDPIAIFSAPWIYKELKSDVVVIIRHPAAFVASLKVANWEFDFNHFLSQPELMNDYLMEYHEEISHFSENSMNIVEQGCLLWNIIYSVVLRYQKEYENKWYFVTHEQLSLQPRLEFMKLLDYIGLKYTERVDNKIKETANSKEIRMHHRDSRNNIKTWKTRLNDEEINFIKVKTYEVWNHFYSEDDWN